MSEKGDIEQNSNSSLKAYNANSPRDQALAALPDPDIGKSDEEKKAIVRYDRSRLYAFHLQHVY